MLLPLPQFTALPEIFETPPAAQRYRLKEDVYSTVKSKCLYGAKNTIVTLIRWAMDVSIVARADGERFAVATNKLNLITAAGDWQVS